MAPALLCGPASMAGDVLAEGGELVVPEGVHLFDPSAEGREWLLAKAVEAKAGVVVRAFRGDEAARPQHAEVAAHGRTARGDARGQIPGPARSAPEEVDHLPAGGVGQGGQGGVDLINHSITI